MYHSNTYGEPFCEVWAQSEDSDFFCFFGVCDKSICFFQIMKKFLRKWQKQRQFTNMKVVLYLLRPKSSLQVENSVSYQHLKRIIIIIPSPLAPSASSVRWGIHPHFPQTLDQQKIEWRNFFMDWHNDSPMGLY